MQIKTAAVLGVGAVGSYLIYGLQDCLQENLWVIAEGERKARLESEGLMINGQTVYPIVKTPEEAKGVDMLFIAVKYGALPNCLDTIAAIAEEHTIVMSLMNGVDSEEMIASRIGASHVIYSMIKIVAAREGNAVTFVPETTQGIYFGKTKEITEEQMAAVRSLFASSQLHYHECKNIIQDIWYKYALNVSKNLPQAMVGCGFGAYAGSEHVMALCRHLRSEVVAVAKAKGIDIADESNTARNGSSSAPPTARFSTLQDLDAKRHTEIEMFAGAMIRMGKEWNIPTPYNEFAYHMIKALEEKNDGKFDF